jgi:hypothetical protein
MKEDEMGRACNMRGRDKKCIQFWSAHLNGKRPPKHLCTDWKIILKWPEKKKSGRVWTR